MPNTYRVIIRNTGEAYLCGGDQNLLRGMELLARRGIPVGCRGGGCGVCKVRIERGHVRTEKMSRAHIDAEQEAGGVVLACRAYPLSDVRLSAVGKMAVCVERNFPRSFLEGLSAAAPAVKPDSLT